MSLKDPQPVMAVEAVSPDSLDDLYQPEFLPEEEELYWAEFLEE